MDDFVKKAFEEAELECAGDNGFHAYKHAILDNMDVIVLTAASNSGMDDTAKIFGMIIDSDKKDTLVEFIKCLVTIGYYIGYREGREGK